MPPTLAEIDEELNHARKVPEDKRGDPWHAYVDGLLRQRLAHAGIEQTRRETRLIGPDETR